MERIIKFRCPGCETGIEYDTLTKNIEEVKPDDYPRLEKDGKCWCKKCQHGTFPRPDGLCSECYDKGRAFRTQAKTQKEVEEVSIDQKPKDEIITHTNLHKKEPIQLVGGEVKTKKDIKKSSVNSK